jgi:hypothetical protein
VAPATKRIVNSNTIQAKVWSPVHRRPLRPVVRALAWGESAAQWRPWVARTFEAARRLCHQITLRRRKLNGAEPYDFARYMHVLQGSSSRRTSISCGTRPCCYLVHHCRAVPATRGADLDRSTGTWCDAPKVDMHATHRRGAARRESLHVARRRRHASRCATPSPHPRRTFALRGSP